MEKTTLYEYVKTHGQSETAKRLGITQAAISKAIANGRTIFVSLVDDKLIAEEVRKFPHTPKAIR